MATIVSADDSTAARLVASLAPVCHAIGLAYGPEGGQVWAEIANHPCSAASGLEIARHMLRMPGFPSAAHQLLRDDLQAFEREFGDGTARLAMLIGLLLEAGIRHGGYGANLTAIGRCYNGIALQIRDALRAQTVAFDALQVARSAGATPEQAEVLAQALELAGEGSAVEITSTTRHEGIRVNRTEGYVYEAQLAGLPSTATQVLQLSVPSVLVVDEVIDDFGALIPVIEGFIARQKSLVIVARGFGPKALALLRANQTTEHFSLIALSPTEAGPRAAIGLEDLAAACGATLVADRVAIGLDAVRPAMLGSSSELRYSLGRAVFFAPQGTQYELQMRRAAIAADIRASRYLSFDLEHARRRLARLNGTWTQIVVGAAFSQSADAQAAQLRRVLASVTLAQKRGTVAGGGGALAAAAYRLTADPSQPAILAARSALLAFAAQHPRHPTTLPSAGLQDPLVLIEQAVLNAFSFAGSILQTNTVISPAEYR